MSVYGDGGSSPFLEEPQSQDYAEKAQSTIRASSESSNDTSNKNSKNNNEIELLNLKYQLKRLENELKITENKHSIQINTLTKKYHGKVDELDEMITLIKNLQQEKETMSLKLENIAHSNNSRENAFQQDNEENLELIDALQNEKIEMQGEISHLKISNLEIETKFNKQEVELQSLQEMLKNFDVELKKYFDEIKFLNKKNLDLETLVEKLKTGETLDRSVNEKLEKNSSSKISSETNDQELNYLKKELNTQLQYLRELESENLKQSLELKDLKQKRENYDFLKTENEDLRTKLNDYDNNLKYQLEAVQLENEKLKTELFNNDKQIELESLKTENVKLIEQINTLTTDFNESVKLKDTLQVKNKELVNINQKYDATIYNLQRLNTEIELQKQLSFEECKLLRQELDEFVSLKADSQNFGGKDGKWNDIVEQYKNQSENLTTELKKLNDMNMESSTNGLSKKRKLSNDNEHQSKELEQVSYSSKFLQEIDDLQKSKLELQNKIIKLESENEVLHSKIEKLENSKELKIRVLQLRDSPLHKDQFVKKKMLQLLKTENNDLLNGLHKDRSVETFPKSVYNRLKMEQDNLELELYKSKKQMNRLKEMYSKKSMEFIESVNQILGFKLEFLPGSKVKVSSCYEPSKNLEIDLINNTLKSSFSRHLPDWDDLLQKWVVERKQIPGLLATIQLQLYKLSEQHKE